MATCAFISRNLAHLVIKHGFLKPHALDIETVIDAQNDLEKVDFDSIQEAYYNLHTRLEELQGITSLEYRRVQDVPPGERFDIPQSLPPHFVDLHEATKALYAPDNRNYGVTTKVGRLIFGRDVNMGPERIRNTVYYLVERVLNMVDEARLEEEDFNDMLKALARSDWAVNLEIGNIIRGARKLVTDGISVSLDPTRTRIYISAPLDTFQENNDRPPGKLLILGGKR